jgi:hypothetical protein
MFCQPRLGDQGLEARMTEALRAQRDAIAQALNELRLAAASVKKSSVITHRRVLARAFADAALAALGNISDDEIFKLFGSYDDLEQFEP